MMDDIPRNFLAFWVAAERQDEEDAIIGMAGMEAVTESAPDIMGVAVSDVARSPSRSARFAAVRVAPERQRLGVGRALTRAGIDWARSQGYERLILDTTRQQEAAIALYESMGFRSLGEERFQHWDVVWFELRL